ncbi:hypothetical protein EZS27_039141, partial [termite gut metagenome]
GAADQSIVDGNSELLSSVNNGIKNYAGSRGAQLAHFLINNCFGFASFLFVIMGSVLGLHLMRVYRFRIWKWLFCCMFLLIWFSVFLGFTFVELYKDSFVCWGGMHGYNASLWLTSQVGVPGTAMTLLATGLCFLIYVSTKTIIRIRQFFEMRHIRRRRRILAKYGKYNDANNNTSAGTAYANDHVPEEKEAGYTGETDMTFEATEPDEVPFFIAHTAEKEDTSFDLETGNTGEGDEDNYQGKETEPYNPKLDLENYHFPTLDLLKFYDNRDLTINMEEQKANKEKIINTLRSFGIEISTIKATVGPTVT